MSRYWIELYQGVWDLCSSGEDGITDVHASYPTEQAARDALAEATRDTSGDERHYWAQCAYACGYHD